MTRDLIRAAPWMQADRLFVFILRMRHLLVNLSLTLLSAFLILKDFRRNRLAERLTVSGLLQPLINMGKNTKRDAIAPSAL